MGKRKQLTRSDDETDMSASNVDVQNEESKLTSARARRLSGEGGPVRYGILSIGRTSGSLRERGQAMASTVVRWVGCIWPGGESHIGAGLCHWPNRVARIDIWKSHREWHVMGG